MRLGIIRVLTTQDSTLLNSHGQVIAEEFGVDTVSRCISDQPHGVHSPNTFEQAAPKVAELARSMSAHDDVDAILLSCAADPGLESARASARVPVVGAGSSAACEAMGLGERIGVLDLTARTPLAVTSRLGDRLLTATVPDGVTESRDLLTDVGRRAARSGAADLVAQGADVVLLACTGMTTIGLRHHLEGDLEVPVVDAVLAGARAAIAAAAETASTP